MGTGYNFICSNCDKEYSVWTGIGYAYPLVYSEAVEKLKRGKFGKEIKDAFLKAEHALLDYEDNLYVCRCGYWRVDHCMDVYSVERKDGEQIDEETRTFIFPDDPDIIATLLYHEKHLCKKCGREMKKIKNVESYLKRYGLPCPKCGKRHKREMSNLILWD